MKKTLSLISLLLLCSLSMGQYRIPHDAQAQLLSKSKHLQNATLFATERCNVLLLYENSICRLDCGIEDTAKILQVKYEKPIRNMFYVGETLVASIDSKIIAFPKNDNRISSYQNFEILTRKNQKHFLAFPALSDNYFFIVNHKWDKKSKQKRSVIQTLNIRNKKVETIFEISGWVNNISGDTSVVCFSIENNLFLVKNKMIQLLCSETSEISSVCLSPFGLFYSTYQSVTYMIDAKRKVVIVEQGALQLIDNCNTLYMILIDGSLIRIHNTLAFAEFYNLFEQYNDEDDNTHH